MDEKETSITLETRAILNFMSLGLSEETKKKLARLWLDMRQEHIEQKEKHEI